MAMNEQLLNILYGICIFLGLITLYSSLRKLFKIKSSNYFSIFLVLVVSIILTSSLLVLSNLTAMYVWAFFLIAILFGICFKFSLNQCLFIGSFYIFHIIAFKGIILGCMSVVLKLNTFMILNDVVYNKVSIILTQGWLFITFFLYMKFMKAQNVRNFLIHKKQMQRVLGCHIGILLFMLFNTFTYYYNLDIVWMSVAQIMISTILYSIYMVVLTYGMHMADLLQHKMRDQKQLETIQAQLRQQNSLLKITEIVNLFKHDYREQLLTIEECIETRQYQKAIDEIKNDCLYQLDKLPHTKKYSNNIIINSLLIACQDVCDEKDIEMEAMVFYPQDLSIKERELHEILRVLTDNAKDANERVLNRKRYMTLRSVVEKQWLSIQIENPYEGIILFDGDRPVSSYEREDNEGMGLIYVEELLEKHGGIIRYENDKKKRVFNVHILIRIDG